MGKKKKKENLKKKKKSGGGLGGKGRALRGAPPPCWLGSERSAGMGAPGGGSGRRSSPAAGSPAGGRRPRAAAGTRRRCRAEPSRSTCGSGGAAAEPGRRVGPRRKRPGAGGEGTVSVVRGLCGGGRALGGRGSCTAAPGGSGWKLTGSRVGSVPAPGAARLLPPAAFRCGAQKLLERGELRKERGQRIRLRVEGARSLLG